MGSSLVTASTSDPVRSLEHIGPASDQIGPRQRKAGLRSGTSLIQVTKEAALRFYGSVKETAFALGQVDPSLMMREFDAGKFARLDEHADDEAKSYIAAAQVQAFGPLSDPKARGYQLVREIEQRIAEIRQLLEMVS